MAPYAAICCHMLPSAAIGCHMLPLNIQDMKHSALFSIQQEKYRKENMFIQIKAFDITMSTYIS